MPATPDTVQLDVADVRETVWLAPLAHFYDRRHLEVPDVQFTPGPELPEVERELLVHEWDMTPTLGRHHGQELRLEVLDKEDRDDDLLRLVILRRRGDLLPVECGAIRIHLSGFKPEVRREIEEGQAPLGGVLEHHKVSHRGAPRGFFSVRADDLLANALGERPGTRLWGRCNELLFPDGQHFAEIVEILPVMTDPAGGNAS